MVNCYICHKPVKVSTEKHLYDEKLKKRYHLRCFAGICPGCDRPVAKGVAVMQGKDAFHKTCLKRSNPCRNPPDAEASLKKLKGKFGALLPKLKIWYEDESGLYHADTRDMHYEAMSALGLDRILSDLKDTPIPEDRENPSGERWLTDEELMENTEPEIRHNIAPLVVLAASAAAPVVAEEGGKLVKGAGGAIDKYFKDEEAKKKLKKNPISLSGVPVGAIIVPVLIGAAAISKDPRGLHIASKEEVLKWWSQGLSLGLIRWDGEILQWPDVKRWSNWWLHGFTLGILKVEKPIGIEPGNSIVDMFARGWSLGIAAYGDKPTSILTENPPRCAGCKEQLTPEEVRNFCVTDDSGTYHAWCYPDLMVLKHMKDGAERKNPRRALVIREHEKKLDVSSDKSYYLVATDGRVVARGIGLPAQAQAHRLRMRQEGVESRVVYPDDLTSEARSAKKLLR
jgi:hypothetical protein